jgi:hypothetical protein
LVGFPAWLANFARRLAERRTERAKRPEASLFSPLPPQPDFVSELERLLSEPDANRARAPKSQFRC